MKNISVMIHLNHKIIFWQHIILLITQTLIGNNAEKCVFYHSYTTYIYIYTYMTIFSLWYITVWLQFEWTTNCFQKSNIGIELHY